MTQNCPVFSTASNEPELIMTSTRVSPGGEEPNWKGDVHHAADSSPAGSFVNRRC